MLEKILLTFVTENLFLQDFDFPIYSAISRNFIPRGKTRIKNHFKPRSSKRYNHLLKSLIMRLCDKLCFIMRGRSTRNGNYIYRDAS